MKKEFPLLVISSEHLWLTKAKDLEESLGNKKAIDIHYNMPSIETAEIYFRLREYNKAREITDVLLNETKSKPLDRIRVCHLASLIAFEQGFLGEQGKICEEATRLSSGKPVKIYGWKEAEGISRILLGNSHIFMGIANNTSAYIKDGFEEYRKAQEIGKEIGTRGLKILGGALINQNLVEYEQGAKFYSNNKLLNEAQQSLEEVACYYNKAMLFYAIAINKLRGGNYEEAQKSLDESAKLNSIVGYQPIETKLKTLRKRVSGKN